MSNESMRKQRMLTPRGRRRATAAWLLAAACGAGLTGAAASAAEVDEVHGSTDGVATASPQWSAGVQLGSYAGTGIAVQRVGVAGGAVNLGLGVGWHGPALSADYLVLLDKSFSRFHLSEDASYNTGLRGQPTPYFGIGATIGPGALLRLPAGVQYAMLRDPFVFFGGVALEVGRYGDDEAGAVLWFNLGARVLL